MFQRPRVDSADLAVTFLPETRNQITTDESASTRYHDMFGHVWLFLYQYRF
jgi:hypothetical protein